ncbi:BglG family transcription antiterminator [Geosporobacter ferrireducens]|uniref:BglG family transcription antiterminator n=2 Tax=Geosporobacter ferrireducens TaxID=1424294 RepID=UPI002352246C|nr:BglG family transcription antiterminator [Geosporobacter ferrireducens]
MVPLTKRQKDIVEYLTGTDDYAKIKTLSHEFGVSERTVRYDLDVIECYLKSEGFELVKKPGVGIKIPNLPDIVKRLSRILSDLTHRIFSPEERSFLIIIYLMTSPRGITIDNLANLLQVSKNTILSDLTEVEKNLSEFHISLNRKTNYGLSAAGEEENIRNSFTCLYYEGIRKKFIIRDQIMDLLNISRFNIQNIICSMERRMDTSYSDISKEELEISIGYTLNRAENGRHIYYSEDVRTKYANKREYSTLLNMLDSAGCSSLLNESDRCYIVRMFMGAKIINAIESKENSPEDEEAKIISKQIIQDAEEYLGIDFSDDYELINGLALHLKVAFHRLRNDLLIENPLTDQIKYRIPFIYEISSKILGKYEKMLDLSFPDSETAYIAMYLGAGFEKKTQNGFMPRVLVVCGSGFATSGILSTRLGIMLPELKITGPVTIDLIPEKLSRNTIDFIISTVDLKVDGYEVIKVNPLLDVSDIEEIKSLIFKNTYKKQCDYLIKRYDIHRDSKVFIKNLLSEDNAKFNVEADNWRNAVKIAAAPLVKKQYISREYVQSIIKAVERLGHYTIIKSILKAEAERALESFKKFY